MNKKIRSISISDIIDDQLIEDSKNRGLTISANIARILYEYFQNNNYTGHKLPTNIVKNR
tara:strand:+ start:1652 stop:1831 length:180 start_codon:yes stop_codon:yes gene_type:complete